MSITYGTIILKLGQRRVEKTVICLLWLQFCQDFLVFDAQFYQHDIVLRSIMITNTLPARAERIGFAMIVVASLGPILTGHFDLDDRILDIIFQKRHS